MLFGAQSMQYATYQWGFGAGAILATFLFIASLGYSARLLAAVLARPRAWVVLEIVIGLIMCAVAASLALRALSF